jgi:hypothetical protein
MRLEFYWCISDAYNDGILRPACKCADPIDELDEIIPNYLMDDSGASCSDSVFWINECLERILLVRKSEIKYIDIDRDAWGARFSICEVKVYSLYDERFLKLISLTAMDRALRAWKVFLQSPPGEDVRREIDLSDSTD